MKLSFTALAALAAMKGDWTLTFRFALWRCQARRRRAIKPTSPRPAIIIA